MDVIRVAKVESSAQAIADAIHVAKVELSAQATADAIHVAKVELSVQATAILAIRAMMSSTLMLMKWAAKTTRIVQRRSVLNPKKDFTIPERTESTANPLDTPVAGDTKEFLPDIVRNIWQKKKHWPDVIKSAKETSSKASSLRM